MIAPLREHKSDIPLLADQFRQRFARKHGISIRGLSPVCQAALTQHSWPGNVRELQNVIERGVILCSEGGVLEPIHLGLTQTIDPALFAAPAPASPAHPIADEAGHFFTLADLEKRHILAAMERAQNNRTCAAEMLDISIRTLRNKLNEYSGKRKAR
jgi:DNA-binding NtrC family response regulator